MRTGLGVTSDNLISHVKKIGRRYGYAVDRIKRLKLEEITFLYNGILLPL